jgi:polyadenylation factor subunit 2
MTDSLPILLPPSSLSNDLHETWTPTKHLEPPHYVPSEESLRQEQAIAVAKTLMDGKALKKTRPRRTVDYGGSMGRWILVRLGSTASIAGS